MSAAAGFIIEHWAALAASLSTPQQWCDWFRQPAPLAREFTPELTWMPAALRRRVSPLGRAALSVLAACQGDAPCPVVLASRYGDLSATAELLTQLHHEGGVSPMGFSLAVHNAAVGIYSIARKDRTVTTSIAARTDLAEAAFFEAMGWLAAGEAEVLVVCGDDPVPPPYQTQPSDFRYAWACRLRAAAGEGFTLQTVTDAPVPEASPPPPPHTHTYISHPCLRTLAFLVGETQPTLTLRSESGQYLWRRHA
jgi:hypothetical protein